MKATALTIFVTPLKGEEIRIEKACTLKQAVTLAKKEARKMIREDKGNAVIMINIQARGIYNTIESLAHIEATPAGRRVAFSDEQPTETYAICWGVEYKEEDGESNAIAETTNEEDAKEFAENESKSNKCRMCVVRKSDGKVIAIYDNTPDNTTPNNNDNTDNTMKANNTRYFINGKEVTANRYAAMKRLNNHIGRKISRGQMEAPTRAAWYTYEAAADAEYDIARYLENCKRFGYLNEEETEPTTDTPANEREENELTEAANLLNIYIDNESDIYSKYTEKAIAAVVDAKRENENGNAQLDDETAWNNLIFWISWQPVVKKAINAAARLVKKFDGVTPTAKDIEQVTRNYAAYIIECAQYQIETA